VKTSAAMKAPAPAAKRERPLNIGLYLTIQIRSCARARAARAQNNFAALAIVSWAIRVELAYNP
jgi:hypothetical protein